MRRILGLSGIKALVILTISRQFAAFNVCLHTKDLVRRPTPLLLALHLILVGPIQNEKPRGKSLIADTRVSWPMECSGISEEWFSSLNADVDPVIRGRWREGQPPVKIAIIDTGIDAKHPILKSLVETGQIRMRSWITAESGGTDYLGHGTHIAHSLLRVAPRASLFIAQVLKIGSAAELESNVTLIANVSQIETWTRPIPPLTLVQAIIYATDGWKVDIISISWGYPQTVPEIQSAIRYAFYRKTIVMAAAGNKGNIPKNPVSFPANMRQVLCINSATGYNKPSAFNPSPTLDRTLTILGESVRAAWPMSLGHGGTSEQSGTSQAVAIAAGVAALVLEYSQQTGTRDATVRSPQRLRHSDEMRKLFHEMAVDIGGYHCINPAKLFDVAGDSKHAIICGTISKILDTL